MYPDKSLNARMHCYFLKKTISYDVFKDAEVPSNVRVNPLVAIRSIKTSQQLHHQK